MSGIIFPALFSIFLGTILLFFRRTGQKGTVRVNMGKRRGASFRGILPFVLITLGIILWAMDSFIGAI